jgi:hypothetical protein
MSAVKWLLPGMGSGETTPSQNSEIGMLASRLNLQGFAGGRLQGLSVHAADRIGHTEKTQWSGGIAGHGCRPAGSRAGTVTGVFGEDLSVGEVRRRGDRCGVALSCRRSWGVGVSRVALS